jgi:DNA helicase IV
MLLTNLNEKQREAVLAEDKRLLVLAGAGSGKTKTLIQKALIPSEREGHQAIQYTGDHVYQKCYQ